MWGIDGERGLARFDGRSWGFLEPPADFAGPVRTLAVAPDGALWAAGDSQIARLDGDDWRVYESVAGVQAIAFTADGSLWLATATGAARFPVAGVSAGVQWAVVIGTQPPVQCR